MTAKLCCLLLLILSASAQGSDLKGGDAKKSLTVDGVTRTYRYHLPSSDDSRKEAPLLLAFHGGGSQGRSMKRLTGLSQLADKEGFIVVYPDGLHHHWNDSRNLSPANDVEFVRALIGDMEKAHRIDRERIYATGISNGGFFSVRLACDLGDIIAAVAAVAATMPEQLPGQCKPSRPISIMFLHGTKDPLIPFQGGGIAGGRHGQAVSLEDAVRFWRDWDHTKPSPEVDKLPDRDPTDGTRVERRTYGGGKEGSEVIAYVIENGGHTWPGGWQYAPAVLVGKTTRDLDGSTVIWKFFQRHRLP